MMLRCKKWFGNFWIKIYFQNVQFWQKLVRQNIQKLGWPPTNLNVFLSFDWIDQSTILEDENVVCLLTGFSTPKDGGCEEFFGFSLLKKGKKSNVECSQKLSGRGESEVGWEEWNHPLMGSTTGVVSRWSASVKISPNLLHLLGLRVVDWAFGFSTLQVLPWTLLKQGIVRFCETHLLPSYAYALST